MAKEERQYNELIDGKEIVPIFFATDDRYAPYLGVALRSLCDNASEDYFYKVYVLVVSLSEEHRNNFKAMETDNLTVDFVNVEEQLDSLGGKLHLRDYYTQATYYRFFIPDLFPQYHRGIYLDCDIVVLGDIAKLYNTEMGSSIVAAAPEEVMLQVDIFGTYVEKVLGIPREKYFSAGIMVMNLDAMRLMMIETAFVGLLNRYTFRVTQDQDYLNVLCYGRVTLLPCTWNKTAAPWSTEKPELAHYKINWKPWHYKGVTFEEYFWDYAAKTPYLEALLAERDAYGDEMKARDQVQYENLVKQAENDIASAVEKPVGDAPPLATRERLAVLERISEYERLGLFDRDVEIDPPTRPLEPGEVDYIGKKRSTRFFTKIANRVAHAFFEKQIKKGNLIIKEVKGLENYLAVADKGALITCNHFNAFDNYAVYKAIEESLGKKSLYKIIREGNFTSFGGLYGFFFRHCNTLPLSTRMVTLRELIESVNILLSRGEKVLIYPEQGMWWNYKKPRPLKLGSFRFAAKAGVPVVPFFITTEETDKKDGAGFPILAYTVHILPAIHPDPEKNIRVNTEEMCTANYNAWKAVYEETYGIPLTYTTEGEVKPCSM